MPPGKRRILIQCVAITVFVLAYAIPARQTEAMLRLCDALFIAGMASILLGLCCHVRNSGFLRPFLYFGYLKYRRKQRSKLGKAPIGTKVMDFPQYCKEKHVAKWDCKLFYICGVPLIILSVMLGQFFLDI